MVGRLIIVLWVAAGMALKVEVDKNGIARQTFSMTLDPTTSCSNETLSSYSFDSSDAGLGYGVTLKTGASGKQREDICCDDTDCGPGGTGYVDCDKELDCNSVASLCPSYEQALAEQTSGDVGGEADEECQVWARNGENCVCTCRCVCLYPPTDLVHWLDIVPADLTD